MIGDNTLRKWSAPGSTSQDTDTYGRFSTLIGKNFYQASDIYLQGSYRNHTDISGRGDIDIVVECGGYFEDAYSRNHDIENLRDDLFYAIDRRNNFILHEGNKAIKYDGGRLYSPVDIVPCIPYYHQGIKGISIYDHRRHKVIHSFPKAHIDNGIEKNGNTRGMFKPMVRVMKNARDMLIENGTLWEGAAPSYFIECLLYNVPDEVYSTDVVESFYGIVEWLDENSDYIDYMMCQNDIVPMFRGDTRWNIRDCRNLIGALSEM